MGSVAEGVKEGDDVFIVIGIDLDDIIGRYADVFGKGTVALNADALGILTPLGVSGAAVAAMTAYDVAFTGNDLADLEALYAFTKGRYFTNVFMADVDADGDILLSPFIPVVYVDVSAADRCLMDLDQHIIDPHFRNRHFLKGKSGSGFILY